MGSFRIFCPNVTPEAFATVRSILLCDRLFVCSPLLFPTADIQLRLSHAGDIHIDRHGSRDILALPGRLHPLQFVQ